MSEQIRTWRIGELAEQAGITVRTLHHYDRLGLLSPPSRTSGGHRSYTRDDVVRLHRIIALRSCGLSLQEIGTVLSSEAEGGLADLLRRQLDVVDERIRQAVALRVRPPRGTRRDRADDRAVDHRNPAIDRGDNHHEPAVDR